MTQCWAISAISSSYSFTVHPALLFLFPVFTIQPLSRHSCLWMLSRSSQTIFFFLYCAYLVCLFPWCYVKQYNLIGNWDKLAYPAPTSCFTTSNTLDHPAVQKEISFPFSHRTNEVDLLWICILCPISFLMIVIVIVIVSLCYKLTFLPRYFHFLPSPLSLRFPHVRSNP